MAIANPKFSGLSDDQVALLLEKIATTMNLMSELCRDAADRHGAGEAAYTFNALDTMLCGVGALADHATGGKIIGDFSAWMLGPMFDQVQQDWGAA